MNVQSASGEQDAGALYPSIIQDTNGNQIAFTYGRGAGASGINSSARITAIYDIRNGTAAVYSFTYNSDPIPHLTSITNSISSAEAYSFTYLFNQSLQSPFTPAVSYTATLLQAVTVTGPGTSTTLQYNTGRDELIKVTTAAGGSLGWTYRTYTYANGASYREVQTRTMQPTSGATQYSWDITLQGDPVHTAATVADAAAGARKVWNFNGNAGAFPSVPT